MLIWFALVLPLIFSLILIFKFKYRVIWWELAIPIAASVILIAICKFSCEAAQTADTEYWGGYVTNAEYYEAWDEEVPCRHDKYEEREESYVDSDGKTQTRTVSVYVGKEHAYDVDDHPPYWQIHDSNGAEITIESGRYRYFVNKFGGDKLIDMHRNYHSRDGDKYVATWPGDDNSLEPTTTKHFYVNRVQASNSVFKFAKVDPKTYGLYKYPPVEEGFRCPALLGYSGANADQIKRSLDLINAKLGQSKQVHVWVLIFTDKPMQAGFEQENFWQGSNKNEFVITIGINKSQEVQWAHVFSWSEVDSLKIDTQDEIMKQKKLDLMSLMYWLGPQIKTRFIRKNFADFNYLSVEPPAWMILLTFFLTLGLNIFVSFWIVNNEYRNEDQDPEEASDNQFNWRRPRRRFY